MCQDARVPFVDTDELTVLEPRAGWPGRFFDSADMTLAYYTIDSDASVHVHEHAQEEVWHVLDGELEFTLGDATEVLGPGRAVVVPAHERHPVNALASAPRRS
jgi:mannose-6-phosphate isomerase-like protein (cupin superfamily)